MLRHIHEGTSADFELAFSKLREPRFARSCVELTHVRLTDHKRKKMRHPDSVRLAQTFGLYLQILGHQLANHDGATIKPCRDQLRSPNDGDTCRAPSITRLALSRGIRRPSCIGAAGATACLISIEAGRPAAGARPVDGQQRGVPATGLRELQPFTQYAASTTRIAESALAFPLNAA